MITQDTVDAIRSVSGLRYRMVSRCNDFILLFFVVGQVASVRCLQSIYSCGTCVYWSPLFPTSQISTIALMQTAPRASNIPRCSSVTPVLIEYYSWISCANKSWVDSTSDKCALVVLYGLSNITTNITNITNITNYHQYRSVSTSPMNKIDLKVHRFAYDNNVIRVFQ